MTKLSYVTSETIGRAWFKRRTDEVRHNMALAAIRVETAIDGGNTVEAKKHLHKLIQAADRKLGMLEDGIFNQ